MALRIIALLLVAHLCYTAEGRWVLAEVTAYCGGPCSICQTDGVTADGTRTADEPYGIAASNDIALQTRIYVPHGYGYLDVSRYDSRVFRTSDRGGLVQTEYERSGITRLDLRYKTHYSAKLFGRKLVWVFIYDQR